MSRTFFQDFTRDDGTPITVEYSVDGSYSPTTYSPATGACGGDAAEFAIIDAWPNSDEYNALWTRKNEIESSQYGGVRRLLLTEEEREELDEIGQRIEAAKVELTDAERERMEAWIAEHYVEEYDDEPSF